VEHGIHEPSIADLLFPTINFVIFAIVLVRFLRGPIREFFRERTERLRAGLAAGKRARLEAEELRAQLARDLDALPGIKERLRSDLLATAEEARVSLLAQGREAADRIRADARLVAEQEAESARRAVRSEIVEEAIRQATALVHDQVKPDDQSRFVRDFVESVRHAS
jgi:F-type H+-transporting ATPase subunit b